MRPLPVGPALLAVAVAAALALGALWWTGNAPPRASGPIAGPPLPTRAVVAAETGTTQPNVYPNPAELLQFDVARVERILPLRDDILRQEAGVLTDGGTVDYSGPVPAGTEFLLDVACVGVGELEVTIRTPDGVRDDRRIGCDGTMATLEFAAGSIGQAVILLVARTTRFVGIAVQLVQR